MNCHNQDTRQHMHNHMVHAHRALSFFKLIFINSNATANTESLFNLQKEVFVVGQESNEPRCVTAAN